MVHPVPLPQSDTPVRKAVRRLRWFIRVFEEQVEHTAAATGNRYGVDRTTLATVFSEWLNAFNAQKPARVEDRQAYVGFAAGLMLRSLLSHKPVWLETPAPNADPDQPAHFWPEGYLYVAFCLNVRGLVVEQDFAGKQELSTELHDPRSWWSFRENAERDPASAIAFLELFAGGEPDWTMPDYFRTGRVREMAERLYAHKAGRQKS